MYSIERLDVEKDFVEDADAAAWLKKGGAMLKHVALWRRIERDCCVPQIEVVRSLVRRAHTTLTALVNLQLTPRIAAMILDIMGDSHTFGRLSHMAVEVTWLNSADSSYYPPVRLAPGSCCKTSTACAIDSHTEHDAGTSCGVVVESSTDAHTDPESDPNDYHMEDRWKTFGYDESHENFTRGLSAISELLAKCPALTSVGFCESTDTPKSLSDYSLVDLFKHSSATILNLRSLSIQLVHKIKQFNMRSFLKGMTLESVINLRICTKNIEHLSSVEPQDTSASVLSDISSFFPALKFLYVAYRWETSLPPWNPWRCGTGPAGPRHENTLQSVRAHKNKRKATRARRGFHVAFPESLLSSQLTTLALDQCFISDGTMRELPKFRNLATLVVVTPTEEVYNHSSYLYVYEPPTEEQQLPRENVRKYGRFLSRTRHVQRYESLSSAVDSARQAKVRIELRKRVMESATNWTSLASYVS